MMLTAMVLVCSLVTENDCMLFTDSRGPYATEEQCLARVEEMITDITPTLPPVPAQFRYKCEQVIKGTAT